MRKKNYLRGLSRKLVMIWEDLFYYEPCSCIKAWRGQATHSDDFKTDWSGAERVTNHLTMYNQTVTGHQNSL